MCRLVLDEKKYNSTKEYWQALIINTTENFTIGEILSHKEKPTDEDIEAIYSVIEDLSESYCIKRVQNRYYMFNILAHSSKL